MSVERRYEPRNIGRNLNREGLDLPTIPSSNGKPNPIIARCEPFNPDKLKYPDANPIHPQCGQMGSFGVFFADSLNALPNMPDSTFYVFARDDISKDWLCTSSLEWAEQLETVAKKRKLNLAKIGDGLDAGRVLYENNCVFQDKIGTCTTPNPVNVRLARLILVPKQYLDVVPTSLRDKVRVL